MEEQTDSNNMQGKQVWCKIMRAWNGNGGWLGKKRMREVTEFFTDGSSM